MKAPRTRKSSAFLPDAFVPKAVVAVVCVLIVAVAGVYAAVAVRLNRASVSRHLEAVQAQKAFELIQWRAERLDDAAVFDAELDRSYADSMIEALGTKSDRHPHLRSFISTAIEEGVYDRALFYDGAGRLIDGYPTPDGDDPSIVRALRSGAFSSGPGFIDFYDDSGGAGPRLAVAAPLGKGGGSWFAVLRIDPRRRLFPMLATWPAGFDSAETLLSRKERDGFVILNGTMYGDHPPLSLKLPESTDGGLSIAGPERGRIGARLGRDYRGALVIGSSKRVESTPWTLVSKIDVSEADAFVRPQLALFALTVVFAIFTVVTGSLAASKSVRLVSIRREASLNDALVASEAKYRQLHESMKDCFGQTDMDGRITLTNAPLRELLGYSEEELAKKSFNDLTPPRWHGMESEIIADQIIPLGYSGVYRKEYIKKDGTVVPVELRTFLLRDSAGTPVGMWAIIRDVSERDRVERLILEHSEELERMVGERTFQLEASNKRLEEFAYTVAHDLRAPLRSIDGFARILEEEYGPALDEEGRRIIGIIRSSDRKMDGLIRDLLAVSGFANAELKPVSVDMKASALEAFKTCADPKALEGFELAVGNLPPVEADASMMARVWTNLLSNAVKFSKSSEAKRIEIAGCENGAFVEYEVRDRGAGFDPAYAGRLFGLFQRLHPAADYPGSGMGLAIVKQIVERHGGSVRAESTPGSGAVFGFSLPIRNT